MFHLSSVSVLRSVRRWFVLILTALLSIVGLISLAPPAHAAVGEAPVVYVQEDVELFTGGDSALFRYREPTGRDREDVRVRVRCSPVGYEVPEERAYPVGKTTITCTATDSDGNTTSRSFTITVIGVRLTLGPASREVTVGDQGAGAVTAGISRSDGGDRSGFTVTFAAAAGLSFADGSTVQNVQTDGRGLATSPQVVVGTQAGLGSVTARVADLRDATEARSTWLIKPGPTVRAQVDGPRSMRSGVDTRFTVTTLDQYGNRTSPSGSPSLSIDSGTCTTTTCRSSALGLRRVTGTFGAFTGTADVDVLYGPTARVEVASATSGSSVVAGEAKEYRVTVTDTDGHAYNATELATFAIAPDGSCTAYVCTATTSGPHTVTASFEGVSGSTSLSVTPGAAATLQLSPDKATVRAGQAQVYSVSAADRFGNSVDTSAATLAITPDGSCAAGSCTATAAGTHTVTATLGSRTATATLTVTPEVANTITLTPTGTSIAAGGTQTYRVRGADTYGNDVGDVTAQSSLTISPDGSCTANTCTATTPGAHTVRATYGSGLVATAGLTVTAGPAAQVAVVSGNAQQAIAGTTFADPLVASVTDAYGNPIAGAPVTFAVSGGSASFAGTSSATVSTNASGLASAPALKAGSSAGSVTVTASSGSATPTTFLVSSIAAGSARADLAITLTAPVTTLPRGSSTTVTVKVTNKGPNPATSPNTVLVAGCGLTITGSSTGSIKGQTVLTSGSSLASGASQTFTVTVKAASNAPRTVVLGAATLSQIKDPSYANNVAGVSLRTS